MTGVVADLVHERGATLVIVRFESGGSAPKLLGELEDRDPEARGMDKARLPPYSIHSSARREAISSKKYRSKAATLCNNWFDRPRKYRNRRGYVRESRFSH